MRKLRINPVLNQLIDERRAELTATDKHVLDDKLARLSDALAVDIGSIRVLKGLTILAESLAKAIIEQSVFGRGDLMIEQRVDPDLQPELYAAAVANVCFTARLTVLEDLPQFYQAIGFQFRSMLNALQKDELYRELFPPEGKAPRGVLFPFHREADADVSGFFYLIEYVPNGRFMRITLESARDSRLRMTRIPHVVMDRMDLIHARLDIPSSAGIIAQGIVEACIQQRWNYSAPQAHFDDLIQFLRKAGLAHLELLSFSWPTPFRKELFSEGKGRFASRLIRVLSALQQSTVIAQLQRGGLVVFKDGESRCYLDLSQRHRCLNLSFLTPRLKAGLPECLDRMPAVRQTAAQHPDIFTDVEVLLIHHLTNEVLGFVQALVDMGARRVDTLWVKYAGAVEFAYKEIMLSLPETIFRFSGLIPVVEDNGFQQRFVLSDEYSPPMGLDALAKRLRKEPHGFLEAMRSAAAHLFFKMALDCLGKSRRFMVVEDGGYIAPVINRLCLEGRTVKESAALFGFPEDALPTADLDMPLGDWLRPVFLGSVEHTRNGYDALDAVRRELGALAYPALSIAVSKFKVNNESRDVVYSCINAIESIMNGMGFTLSDRTGLVLGAEGALGRKSMRILADRLGAGNLYGVDLVEPKTPTTWTWARELSALPDEALRAMDLICGVIGASICKADWIERLLMHTTRRHLFFASGSTKTVEFSDLTNWLSECMKKPHPMPDGNLPRVALSEIHDPKTGAYQGRDAQITFGEKTVTLHLLADLMPINFLYYGVPSETMNHVMNELLELSAALVRTSRSRKPLPPTLLALDHQISVTGRLL